MHARSERAKVVHLAHIVAKGIPVTTAECSLAVGGNVRRMPRSHLVEHMASTQEVSFAFGESFKTNYPQVVSAVKQCVKNVDCHWSVAGKSVSCGNSRSSARGSGAHKSSSAPASGGNNRSPAPARGGGNRSPAPASGGSSRSPAPASGGSNKPLTQRKKVTVEATDLESIWQSLLLLRRVRNSKSAPLVWRRDRVGM